MCLSWSKLKQSITSLSSITDHLSHQCIINKNKLDFVFTGVAHNSRTTDKPVAPEFPMELEFRNADFLNSHFLIHDFL